MMHMTFYWGRQATILFDSWRTDSWLSYALSLLALLLAAAFYQYMEDRRIRFRLLSRPKTASSIEAPLLAGAARTPAVARAASTVLFGVNSAIGYLLMLAVMSFNGGVFIAVVVGLSIGYLFFRSGGVEEDVIASDSACACA